MPQRYFIYFSYNGSAYCGWQIQPNGTSVQEVFQNALSLILREQIEVVAAGRTDAGVHARSMVAHFDLAEPIALSRQSFISKLNSVLPNDIAVQNIAAVTPDAHARFDAITRQYEYWIIPDKNVFLHGYAMRIFHPLDFNMMNQAAQVLFDYTDFTSFSKLHTDVKTNNCIIKRAEWHFDGIKWIFTIEADRFLRNMVRAIVGTLLEVGRHKMSIEQFRNVIESLNRGNAGISVPAHGLYLTHIEYPDNLFQL